MSVMIHIRNIATEVASREDDFNRAKRSIIRKLRQDTKVYQQAVEELLDKAVTEILREVRGAQVSKNKQWAARTGGTVTQEQSNRVIPTAPRTQNPPRDVKHMVSERILDSENILNQRWFGNKKLGFSTKAELTRHGSTMLSNGKGSIAKGVFCLEIARRLPDQDATAFDHVDANEAKFLWMEADNLKDKYIDQSVVDMVGKATRGKKPKAA